MRSRLAWTMLTAATLTAVPVAAKDPWIGLRTAHLNIVSHASERATRTLAERIERFIDGIPALVELPPPAGPPVTAFVFGDRAAFEKFLPKQRGRTLAFGAYFERGDDESYIVLSAGAAGTDSPYRVIFHEYVHALTAKSAAVWPLWLQEGLAEFCSTFEANGRRIELGRPIAEHLTRLEREPLLPVARLFSLGRQSPMYGDADKQNILYAQS